MLTLAESSDVVSRWMTVLNVRVGVACCEASADAITRAVTV